MNVKVSYDRMGRKKKEEIPALSTSPRPRLLSLNCRWSSFAKEENKQKVQGRRKN